MKAKHIKKLREQVKWFRKYKIQETTLLFGQFDSWETDYDKIHGKEILATSSLQALSRYMGYFMRRYKKGHKNYRYKFSSESEKWAKFMVVDGNGYKRFYS